MKPINLHERVNAVIQPVSILMPVHNEVEGIEAVIAEYVEVVFRYLAEDSEFIVLESGSTDGTQLVLKGLAERWPFLQVITQINRHGFAAAARELYTRANCPLLILHRFRWPVRRS